MKKIGIRNNQGESVEDIDFGGVLRGFSSDSVELIIRNEGDSIGGVEFFGHQHDVSNGSVIETAKSTFFSMDEVHWVDRIKLSLGEGEELSVFVRWQPPSNARIGDKDWMLYAELTGMVSVELC